jgi:hypothetical protein
MSGFDLRKAEGRKAWANFKADVDDSDTRFLIPVMNLPKLGKKLDTLSKKAVKLGLPPIECTALDTISLLTKGPGKDPRVLTQILGLVEIKGQAPKVDGWTFVATIDHMHSEPLIRPVPGYEVPDVYQKARAWQCDHCNTMRRRKETFVIMNEEGEFQAVGRNCLGDFLGGKDPKRIANYMQWIHKGDHGLGWDGHFRCDATDLHTFVAWGFAAVDEYGWVSKQKARESQEAAETAYERDESYQGRILTATASQADLQMHWRAGMEKHYTRLVLTDDHTKKAEEAIEFCKTLKGEGDFVRALQIISKDGFFRPKEDGFAAAIVVCWLKEFVWSKQPKKEKINSQHLGKKGERITAKVKVRFLRSIPNQFTGGSTLIHNMIDENSNVIVWFCNGEGFEEGQELTIAGKVKAHNEYNGTAQTVLTYVKAVGPELTDDIPF